MNKSEQYTAAAWFIAGYLDAVGDYEDEHDRPTEVVDPKAALRSALDGIEQHRRGECLACGRGGVVILDGYFCERCSPGIAAAVTEGEDDG